MSPDTHRHESWAGYQLGCRDECCTTAARRYQKARVLDAHRGMARTVDPTGTRRRFQALATLGWTGYDIARRLGHSREWIRQVSKSTVVHRTTAVRVAEVYADLCMTPAPTDTHSQRIKVSKAKRRAALNGWAPPLAWDDIDCDDEPTGIYVKPTSPTEWLAEHAAKRAADLEHAIDVGRTLEQAADDLSLTTEAVEVWCKRKGRTDLLATLQKRSREREMGAVA